MRYDFFHRTEGKNSRVKEYTFNIDAHDLPTILATAYELGLPKGSHRAGCFQIQGPTGVWRHVSGKRIDVTTERRAKNVEFKSWEQMEAEEGIEKVEAKVEPVKRDDVHRPSEIVPADYDYVGIEYDKTGDVGGAMMLAEEQARIAAHMKSTGGSYSNHQHGGNCHVCGAHALYTVIFYHRASNTYIRTGFDCARSLKMGDEAKFRAIRKAVKDARDAKAGKQKAKALLGDAGCEHAYVVVIEREDDRREPNYHPDNLAEGWLKVVKRRTTSSPCDHIGTRHEEHVCYDYKGDEQVITVCARCNMNVEHCSSYYAHDEIEVDVEEPTWGFGTMRDIVRKLVKYGSISDKQMALVKRILDEQPERVQRDAERQAQRDAEKADAKPAPTGRIKNEEFIVLKTEHRDYDDFVRHVMTVKHIADGWVAWGTCPSGASEAEKGDRIRLSATYKPSDRDPKFAFFSRPNGVVLEQAAKVDS